MASQYQREDLVGSCDKEAEILADTSSLDFFTELKSCGHHNSGAHFVNTFLYIFCTVSIPGSFLFFCARRGLGLQLTKKQLKRFQCLKKRSKGLKRDPLTKHFQKP